MIPARKIDITLVNIAAADLRPKGMTDAAFTEISSNVIDIVCNDKAYAALKNDGSVITWSDDWTGNSPDPLYGGDSTSVANQISSGVTKIVANKYSLAALKSDGSVIEDHRIKKNRFKTHFKKKFLNQK